MKKVLLTLTMLLFAFTGVMRASAEQGNVRADQVIEQGFEDGMGDWTMNHCHSSSGPTSSYGGNTGSYAFRFYYTANYPQYLISPELDDNDGVNFTFYAARYSSNYPETFKVGYSSTTNEPTEFTWDSEVTCTTMYGAGAYQEYSYDFPAGTKYVSIACTSNDQFYMFVDDITVTATEPAPAPTPGGIVEVTIGDPTSTTTNQYLPGYTLYDYAISQQIYTADEIGVAGTINTLTVWLKNTSSYARNINVYMKEVEATEFASNTAWESFAAADMVASFTMPNGNDTPIEVALPLDTPLEYSGNSSLAICFQDVTGSWSSGLGGVEMAANGNQAIYAYRDGTVYDPSNVGVTGTLLSKKNVIRLSIMTSGGGAQTAFSTIPEVLDLGPRPNGAWMAPYVFNLKSNVGAVTVNALDFSGNYFTYNAELPATVTASLPLEVSLTTGDSGVDTIIHSTMTVLYGSNRDAEQFEVTAYSYNPTEGDVFETAIEVPMALQTEYTEDLSQLNLYKNYDLPYETTDADAVYKVTFDQDVLFYAGAEQAGTTAGGGVTLYTEDFNGEDGPMADNNYVYNGPQVNPGPVSMWFSYNYTGSNTFFGTSAGGGMIFGYRITPAMLQELGLGNCAITTVEAAAREGSYYDLMILKGGDTPDVNNMVYYQSFDNYEPYYFFDVNLDEPQFLGDDENIWVMFSTDSPYAAYCGRQPVDAENSKIWYTTNLTNWYSNTSYTPVIYTRFLELPTGREVTVNLADMKIRESKPAEGQIAEANGDVMGVSKAQIAQNNRGNRDDLVEVTIGDPTSTVTNSYLPGYTLYDYAISQQIYTADEIGMAGTINTLTMWLKNSSSYARNINVYMKEVEATEFASATAWESFTAADMVVSFTMPNENSTPIEVALPLDNPFEYSGDGNLAICFQDVTGQWSSGMGGVEMDAAGNQAIYAYRDGTVYDPSNPGVNGTLLAKKNVIRLGIMAGGDTPTPGAPFAPSFTAQIDGMYVPAGTYYVVATGSALNMAIDEVPVPEQAIVYAPYDGETNVTTPYLAEWILGDYTEEMQVLVGTQYPPQTPLIDWTDYLVESAFLMDLEPNQSYFMQVNARNAAGTTMGEIIAFTTPIDPVQGLAVENNELYPGDAAVFSWDANRSFQGYNLYMSPDGGQTTIKVNDAVITGTEYTVEDLAYNMDGYMFAVTAVYDAGESDFSNIVTVYMTGNGTVNGHVYDTDVEHPIANATIEFRGIDEYGVEQVIPATADENGAYTAEVLAGQFTPYLVMEGYAEIAGPDQNIAFEGVYDDVDIFAHEYYYPLSQITATEQTEENNVLVEWSWTPAEYIVDFETGDFSQAEFTLPASYPWTVTTTNPHDGTYGMKSTCEGIASGISSIEVTVDVPFDGKMGFWVRVSSEANYDKFHFYIDGVEKGAAISGQQAYAYKEFDVTEGTHTYKWEYAKDSSVNSNDDCAYVDDITLYRYEAPLPPVVGATVYDFEDGTMQGWTSLDADGDGNGWVSSTNPGIYHNSGVNLSGTGNNASEAYVISGSYANQTGQALTPDNYLVAPAQISAEVGAQIQFYACAQDASYAAEHFGVAVSTTTATPSAFTTIQEWTMTAKGVRGAGAEAVRDVRGNRQGTWYLFTVDLSAYAGQDIWVAIRHFNCTDMFILNVDDITLATGGSKPARNDRSLTNYILYRRNNYDSTQVVLNNAIASDVYEYIDGAWSSLPFGMYQWGIQAAYSGYAPTERSRETATYGFENGLDGWTGIVVNTDGGEWIHSNNNLGGYDYTELAHTGTGFAMCYSYVDYDGPYDTDAYLVSPQKYAIGTGSTISFWADNANDSYPENFSVCVSTADTPTANSFTEVWSGGAKGTGSNGAEVRRSENRYENWRSHEISLAAYAGQEVWIAFHDVNYDMYEIWIDDVTINYESGSNPPTPPTPQGDGLSEIIWSNVIEKDMEATVTFNVALNNGQSPVGATVAIVGEETYNGTIDENGTFEVEIRKGQYDLEVALEGFDSWTLSEEITADVTYDITLNELIAPVEDLYVSPTGWAKWKGGSQGTVNPTPGPGTGSEFTEGFENGMPDGWTVIDANNDGWTWCMTSAIPSTWTYYASMSLDWYRTGSNAICSGSYINGVGALNPDEYLVTPQVTLVNGSTFSFWAAATDASYPADHFGVFVSDNGTSNWTMVNEWTLTAKSAGNDGGRASRDGEGAKIGTWYNYSVDLSAYAGQKYIALRHFNCNDMYIMCVDDIELTCGSKGGDRAPLTYKVKLDGIYEGETVNPYFQHNVDGMEPGSTHVTEVRPIYMTGMADWMSYEWVYTPCDEYAGVTDLNADATGTTVNLTWTMPDGTTPGPNPPTPGQGQWYYYDNGVNDNNIGASGAFYWAVMFPAGSYTGDFVTKVATYDSGDAGYAFTGTATIYQGGTSAPGTAVGTVNVATTGATADFIEYEFAEPVAIDATQNLWVVFYNATSTSYCATAYAESGAGDANARWVSLDGSSWMDLATAGISGYGWMLRVYVAEGAKGEVHEITVPTHTCNNAGILSEAPVTGNRAMWDLEYSFTGTSAGQQAVCTDGTYIYTASWQSTPTGGHTFYQYDLQGNFIEGFEIAGATGIRDITTDGEYFYGTSGGTQIFIMDFTTRTLVGTINCSGLTSRHISYDPERDGFWSGNWSTLALYSRSGALIQNGPAPSSAYGSAYYKDADGVEHLFLFCQPNSDCKVYDYNITTGTLGSSVVLDYSAVAPGCTGIAGGCFVGTYNNKTCWFGNAQQDPNLIAIFELDATSGPVPPTPPAEGILGAYVFRNGELISSVDPAQTNNSFTDEVLEPGEYEYCVRVVYDDYSMSCPVCETVTITMDCDPVTDFAAAYYWSAEEFGAHLTWTSPNENVVAYDIYVDGLLFEENVAANVTSVDYVMEVGSYEFGIVAKYPYCESEMATASVEVTSVSENNSNVAIYPNPTNSTVTVEAAGMNHITVVNALGQIVYDADVNADMIQLNLGQYKAGLYMVRINTEEGVSVQRVTVVK